MLTNLEKYLADKRAMLDVECPDDQAIWQGITDLQNSGRGKSGGKNKLPFLIRARNAAAIIIILFSIGYITNDLIDQEDPGLRIDLSEFSKTSGKKETEYKNIVNLKINEVKGISNTNDLIIKELFEEIEKLDIIYEQALKDLGQIGYNEKIINTIFDTYEKKIRILELIIHESNKSVSYENNAKFML